MKRKLGLFLYEEMDYKAAEDWLNRQAAAGWGLDRIWLNVLAWFRPSGRTDLRYCVDLHRKPDEYALDMEDYYQLCADAGWEYVAQSSGMAIFASSPVARPVPLQTDRKMEERTYWKRAIRPAILGHLLLLGLLAALAALWGWLQWRGVGRAVKPSEILCSTACLFGALGVLCCVIGLLWSIPAGLLHWRRWKRAVEREEPVASSPFWSRFRGGVGWLGWLLMELCVIFQLVELFIPFLGYSGYDVAAHRPELRERPLAMAEEMGVDPNAVTYIREEPVWSLLVQGLRYHEDAREEEGYQFLSCDRYTCVSDGYASLLVRAIRWESGRSGYEAYGLLDFVPVELGLDESWSARDGSFLLLREGRTVALVGAHILDGGAPDLTGERMWNAALERLDLE